MRNNATAKTKSALKAATIVIAVLAAAALYSAWQMTTTSPKIVVNDKTYKITVASNPETQMRGLSGRANLPDNEGMLFSYTRPDELCFWMKDMQFPIDMIWIDPLKKVTHIERNVLPETYPTKYCADGQYVLELNAGQAEESGVRVGQTVQF